MEACKSLVYKHRPGWNVNKNKNIFQLNIATAILRLPALAPGGLEDHLLWNNSKTGMLTVKAVNTTSLDNITRD